MALHEKWFEYEVQVLVPFISNSPLIFWLYPLFGIRGVTWFLGVSEWLFCALLFLGFWNKELEIPGPLGSVLSLIGTITIIPFMPDGRASSAGGFPAMTGNVAFPMRRWPQSPPSSSAAGTWRFAARFRAS